MPPLAASTPLAYQEDNPKPEDSAAYARYHKYKGAQTFEAFLQSGGTLRDLRKDKKNGYVAVDADMDGAEALVKKLTAPKSLVPRWRAMKRIQNDLAAFDTGVDPGGEYVQPKPSFMDPIGDVPRRAPLFHSTRRRRPPPAELLRHRALVRTALSTPGFDGADKIAKAGNGGQKLCWPAMPLESTYRLRAPPTPAQVEAMRLRETEPLVMEPWRPAGAGCGRFKFITCLLRTPRPARCRREHGRRHRRGPRALRFTRGILAVLEPPPRVQEPLLRQGRPRREAQRVLEVFQGGDPKIT